MIAPTSICRGYITTLSRRILSDHSASIPTSSGTLLTFCKRFTRFICRPGPPCINITPPSWYCSTSFTVSELYEADLFEYTGIIISCAIFSSRVILLITESTHEMSIFQNQGSSVGTKLVFSTSLMATFIPMHENAAKNINTATIFLIFLLFAYFN